MHHSGSGLTASGFTIILIGCVISYVATSLFTGCTVSAMNYLFEDSDYHYNPSTNSIVSNKNRTSTITSAPIKNVDGTTTVDTITTTLPVSSEQNLLTSLFLLMQLIVFCFLLVVIANYFGVFFSSFVPSKQKSKKSYPIK